ncbi:MAG: IclR family transcriptional regulator [Planctomycetota bacterium]|nr:IclR family transcriptional regulator [Planctomycetota bacterium]
MESTVLTKAFRLLEVLGEWRPAEDGMPLSDLAEQTRLTKPTAHRVLNSLVGLGYAERLAGGRYRLTAKLKQVATGPDDRRLLAAAEPLLARLNAETGETVNLGVLRQGRVRYLRVLESRHPLRRVAEPHGSDPFHTTALGRAMAAFAGAAQQEQLLKHTPREQRTPYTVMDAERLRGILKETRKRGYAIEQDETDIGVMCLGAPVFDGEAVAAAISVSAPTARVDAQTRRHLIEAVREACRELSARLAAPEGRAP